MPSHAAVPDNPDVPSRAEEFLALHVPGEPLLMPNAWDIGSAKILAELGFAALATTSSGFAATLGRGDGQVDRDEALEHAATLVSAVRLPVSADLENGFGHEPATVAETITAAASVGLAGGSIEDYTGDDDDPIYPLGVATERVEAAVLAAHGARRLILTARCENYLRGRPDLSDTIARLEAYRAAGADVLYAPGLTRAQDIRAVVRAVGGPVNVLIFPGAPGVPELAELGVARVSVGGAFAFAAYGTLRQSAEDLRAGRGDYLQHSRGGSQLAEKAFSVD